MTDDPHPYRVTRECPNCGNALTITWPPDNPDEVELLCRYCEEDVTIPRDVEEK
jgi:hypothetical protein